MNAASSDVAIEYRHPGPCDAETIRLPLDALGACEGRHDDPVTIESYSDSRALLCWVDGGVPRQVEYDQPKVPLTSFPLAPLTYTLNEPELWLALREAVATSDESSTRYALGCVHLRGKSGRIEATDGQQVLIQSGYRFGFEDDVLIPASRLLGSTDMDLRKGVAIGGTEEWLGLSVGCVLILLRVQKDARFPKIDQILPASEAAKSRLELSGSDAQFLAETLPRLPCDDASHGPITLDLNGQVLIRSRETSEGRPTEVVLASSNLDGDPVLLNTNRCYVERALKLGFTTVYLYGAASPALCKDANRQFLWALLDKDSAIKRTDHAVRIESPDATQCVNRQSSRPRRPTRLAG